MTSQGDQTGTAPGFKLVGSFISGKCAPCVFEMGLAAWADVSGKRLEADEVMNARRLEMVYFESMSVCTRAPREHQRATGENIIGARLIGTNQGDAKDMD